MEYRKLPESIKDQILRLQARGLVIEDIEHAEKYLSNISYYRLRAYTFPFQDNEDPSHPFILPVSLSQILSLYFFDQQLRILVFDVLEKIEIGLRTQIIHQWAMTNGSHWHTDPSLFKNRKYFDKNITSLRKEIYRSSEKFLEHYSKKYTAGPDDPPVWMSLEVSSFGLLSLFFSNLKKGPEKKAVTQFFGLDNDLILKNWIHSFCNIRNICAHHSRLWNRRLIQHVKFPINAKFQFVENANTLYPYKLYSALSCMRYILNIVNPDNDFFLQLTTLIDTCPMVEEKEMGFPDNWRGDPFWNN